MTTIRDAFSEQIAKTVPLNEIYFHIDEADRYKIPTHIQNHPGYTDEAWEAYKTRRLITYCGTKKQIGDTVLMFLLLKETKEKSSQTNDVGWMPDDGAFADAGSAEISLECVVERDITNLEQDHIFVSMKGKFPLFVKKEEQNSLYGAVLGLR